MQMEIERRGDTILLQPSGRITEVEAHQFEHELEPLMSQTPAKLVLVMSNVDFVTSSFLGTLMATLKRARQSGGFVRLVDPQPLVKGILATTKLTKLFPIYDSIQAAMES